jgi:hypothetical protein
MVAPIYSLVLHHPVAVFTSFSSGVFFFLCCSPGLIPCMQYAYYTRNICGVLLTTRIEFN